MQLLSIEFAIFFLIFFPIYWLASSSRRLQNLLLLAATGGWLIVLNPMFAAILAIYAILISTFALNIQTEQHLNPSYIYAGKKWLIAGITLGIGHLAFFKYNDFFRQYFPEYLSEMMIDIIMPLGISYYTFQSITYLHSLYKREVPPLSSLDLLTYLSFFPTITSGPIWRAGNWKTYEGEEIGAVSQFQSLHPRTIIRPALAMSLILLGIIKKWWLAGMLENAYVNPIFDNPLQYDALSVLLAVYSYTVQLFLDFSGYTDLAIGIAMLLGFQLPANFAAPFLAHNLRDFWNRWHISLSTWVRDYIYIPLGGSRAGFLRTQFNLIISMVISGVWHGAGITFVVWGLLHGLGLAFLNIGDRILGGRNRLAQTNIGRYIGIFFTFNFVAFVFIVFKCKTLEESLLMLQGIFLNPNEFNLPTLSNSLLAAALVLAFVGYREFIHMFKSFVYFLERINIFWWSFPLSAILFFVIIVAPSGVPGFIYANF